MTLARTADVMASATSAHSAVLAFNVITIEHAEAIAHGVERVGGTALMQISENTVRFHGGRMAPLLAACARIATESTAPLAIHLDHFQDVALIDAAIGLASELGVSSIMIDAAHLPYQANVERTRMLTLLGRAAGLWVEAELGEIGGKEGPHAAGVRTDPGEASTFAEATSVDGLAVAVGSRHAMTSQEADLDIDLIAKLASAVPIPLVLHGSSGVPDDVLLRAVHAGMRKVNIGTALNVAFTGAARRILSENPAVVDPRKYLEAGREAIADTVARLCHIIALQERTTS